MPRAAYNRTSGFAKQNGGLTGRQADRTEFLTRPLMVHQKAPCCKAGRFSYVDLYWENRHLVSGLSFLVYTSEYSISGLRMCLQNGGSAVS